MNMKRCFLTLASAVILTTSASCLHAQALPAATKGGEIQVWLAGSSGQTDYYSRRISGVSLYGTFDFTKHFGVEAAAHVLTLQTPDDYSQRSYEAGIRYFYPVRRYVPYAKVMAGVAGYKFTQPYNRNESDDTFSMYSFGGGLDIKFAHRINVRAIDFEEQKWSGFPPNGLTPTIISIGVAYNIR